MRLSASSWKGAAESKDDWSEDSEEMRLLVVVGICLMD